MKLRTKKKSEKINDTKTQFFEKINKVDTSYPIYNLNYPVTINKIEFLI